MKNYLNHADIESILRDGPKVGTLQKAYMAHAEFEPRPYGFYDEDNIGKNVDNLPDHAIDSIGFSKNVKIAPKVAKLPTWVEKIWNSITVMPNGRLTSNVLSTESMDPYLHIIGNLKEEQMASATPYYSVVAESFYVKMKLDRDDIIDLSDFDVVSYLKSMMTNKMKEFLAGIFLKGESGITSIVSISDAATGELSYDESDILTFAAPSIASDNMSLIVARSVFNSAVAGKGIASLSDIAEFIGVREIIPVPDDAMPQDKSAILMDLSSYCVGLPKGLNGDFFSDFDIDYNTYKIMLETKACALPCSVGFTYSAE